MRKRVRLVAKGYTEVWGEDYWHTYSPTLGHDTLFLCLAYAATHDLEIHQMDTVAAYLNSDLTEIYLRPLEGIPASSNTVLHFYFVSTGFDPFETNLHVHCRCRPSCVGRKPSIAPSYAIETVYTCRVNSKFI